MPISTISIPAVETERQREVFEVYFSLGGGRCIADLRRRTGHSPDTLKKWRHKFDWNQRVAERRAEELVQREAQRLDGAIVQRGLMPDRVTLAAHFLEGLNLLGDSDDASDARGARKIAFLSALWRTCGNVTHALCAGKVASSTYRCWMNNDQNFAAAVACVNEAICDYAESKLFVAMGAGEPWAINKVLNNLRPERWNERRFEKPLFVHNELNVGAGSASSRPEESPDADFDERVLDAIIAVPVLRRRILERLLGNESGRPDSAASSLGAAAPIVVEGAVVSEANGVSAA